MDSICNDMRIEVVYYRWWDSDTQRYILNKLDCGIPHYYEIYAFAINVEANNKAFLEYLPTLMDKGWNMIENELAGMMAVYVKAMANQGIDNSYRRKYYNDWLTNTEILCKNEPSILRWCDEYRRFLDGDDSIFFDEPTAIKKLREDDQATETGPVTVQTPSTANEPTTPQPQPMDGVNIDGLYKTLEQYFTAPFKGVGNNNINSLEISLTPLLFSAIQLGKKPRYFAQVAKMIYQSKYAQKFVKSMSFAGWLRVFCDAVRCAVPKDTNPNKYEPDKSMRQTYIFLT